MVRVNVWDADWVVGFVESTTVIVTDDEPAAPGMPEITPAGEMARAAGRPVADQVYGVVPPVAAMLKE